VDACWNLGMPAPATTLDYRLAPAAGLRLLGAGAGVAGLVALALAGLAVAGGPAGPLVIWFAATVLGLSLAAWTFRYAWVVRFTAAGYRVRGVRGVGDRRGGWDAVRGAAALTRHGVRCLELSLTSGGHTTIPVGLLAVDGDDFVREVQARLQVARGLQPYVEGDWPPPTTGL
jgi:hypothetical protein